MIKHEDLLESGYQTFNAAVLRPNSYISYQKRVQDNEGTKYFINIHRYEYEDGDRFEIDCQFTRDDDCFNIFMFNRDDHTIEYVEKTIEDFWVLNKFNYYEWSGQ